ncbi:hypothetical protein Pelo_2690 [Pelomyxa schiedti]|nr:hypothetical protein Pelo_2690 [Pelomyxa schiedti]
MRLLNSGVVFVAFSFLLRNSESLETNNANGISSGDSSVVSISGDESNCSGCSSGSGEYVHILSIFICGIASVLGCTFVVASVSILGKVKKFYWRLVFTSCMSQGLSCLALVIGATFWEPSLIGSDGGPACQFQGFLIDVFYLASYFWVFVIAFVLNRLTQGKSLPSLQFEIVLHLSVWSFLIIMATLPFYVPSFAYVVLASGWCWLKPEPAWARFLLSYIPEWCLEFAVIGLYANVARMLYKQGLIRTVLISWCPSLHSRGRPTSASHLLTAASRVTNALRQLILYPLAMLVVWVPCTAARIAEAISGTDNYVTSQVVAIFLPSAGFFSFLVFILTADLKTDLYHTSRKFQLACNKCIDSCCHKEHITSLEISGTQ